MRALLRPLEGSGVWKYPVNSGLWTTLESSGHGGMPRAQRSSAQGEEVVKNVVLDLESSTLQSLWKVEPS